MIPKQTISKKIKEINGKPWSPVDIAKVNDQAVRLALFEGEYHWHTHKNEDEFFLVHSGEIVIQIKDQPDINLKTGETAVIPKGIEHCPKSIKPSYVLMFEPQNIECPDS